MSHDLDFLKHHKPPRRRSSRLLRWGVSLIILLVLAWGSLAAYASVQVASYAFDGRDALERAREAAISYRFDDARSELVSADVQFERARTRLAILAPLKTVPRLRQELEALEALTDSGRSIIAALLEVIDLGSELLRLAGLQEEQLQAIQSGVSPHTTFNELSPQTKRLVLDRLRTSAQELELLDRRIHITESDLARLDLDALSAPIRDALLPIRERIGVLRATIHLLSIAARVAPEFTGLDEERNNLLLFLNNAELRPGGGFIGFYGVMRMRNAEITNLHMQDVYALDEASVSVSHTPPAPIAKYLGVPTWYFRDANWSPDFAESAQQIIARFHEESGSLPPEVAKSVQPADQIHNIIAFTPTFAEAVLEITGPIEVDGERFTSENVFDLLEYEVEIGFQQRGESAENRKRILGNLVNGTLHRLYEMPVSDWMRLINEVQTALNEKQFVLYSSRGLVEETISRAGWGGRVLPADGDVQMVVDANLGSLKSDPAVERTLSYEVYQNTSGAYIGRTRITYTHHGAFDFKTTRYRTYTRLYAPAGTTFIRVEGALENDRIADPSQRPGSATVEEDLGLLSMGAFISIEPGQTRSLTFEYVLASSVVEQIKRGAYRLQWIKQIGSAPHALTLDLNFGKNVLEAVPAEEASDWGDAQYHLNTFLEQDRLFEVGLEG